MLDEEIASIASKQYGMFDFEQVENVGGTERIAHDRLNARRWTHEGEAVYGFPDWPESWMRSLWREYLIVGRHRAVVAGESGASVHRLHPFPRFGRLELCVPHGDHPRPPLAVVRQPRDLTDDQIVVMYGMRTTSVARTLCDLAAGAHRERLTRAIEQADLDKKCPIDELAALYDRLRKPGKTGFKMLGSILEVRRSDFVVPESELERRFRRLVREFRLPEPTWQPRLPWNPSRRADGLWMPQRVLLELDSRAWHARIDQMANDRRRDRTAKMHGYDTHRFTYEEVKYQRRMVANELAALLGLAA